jgi:transcriptional regulator with XRE-family HTH domain
MTINQRLKDFSGLKKISNIKLAELAGCSQQVVGSWFNNNVHIKGDYILKIIEAYTDLNARWLITGEGDMFDELIQTPTEQELTEFGTILMDRLLTEKEKVGELKNEIKHLNKEIEELKGDSFRGQSKPEARAG